MIKLFGFSLLRNGVKYDYSFKESLLSMQNLVEEIYLALDRAEDSTYDVVSKIPNLKIIDSLWDMDLKKGLVLSIETNKALSTLRAEHHEESDWGIYLQADEVIHEDDLELIKADLEKANTQGCDAVAFRYLHFWQTHHHLAIAKNWYPDEIRAVKLKSNVESYGDAQSFKNQTKVYYSEARIFHYGHVRDQSIYKNKMSDMSKLYDLDATKSKYYNQKDRDKEYTDCLLYYGSHPMVMRERILRMNDIFELPKVSEIYIVDSSDKYSEKFKNSIRADKIHWVSFKKSIPKKFTGPVIIPKLGLVEKIFKKSIPLKMKSKVARNWNPEFRLTLLLSEKNVGVN